MGLWQPRPQGFSLKGKSPGDEVGIMALGLVRKTTTLYVHHAFLYISLPSQHDYDVK